MRAVDQAYQTVRDGIISGRYPPASRITEQEIAEAAGVSRTPVREALRRLHGRLGTMRITLPDSPLLVQWERGARQFLQRKFRV